MSAYLIGGEGGIRTHGTLARTPIFKTGALNQLDHLSVSRFITITFVHRNVKIEYQKNHSYFGKFFNKKLVGKCLLYF